MATASHRRGGEAAPAAVDSKFAYNSMASYKGAPTHTLPRYRPISVQQQLQQVDDERWKGLAQLAAGGQALELEGLLGLGIGSDKGISSPTHVRVSSPDESDADTSASSLATLVDSFPPPPSSTPRSNSPSPSSPTSGRRFRRPSTSPKVGDTSFGLVAPVSPFAEPISPEYSPLAPPRIPLPALPAMQPTPPSWTLPATPLPLPPSGLAPLGPSLPPRHALPALPSSSSALPLPRRPSLVAPPPSPPEAVDFIELLTTPLPKKRLSNRRSFIRTPSPTLSRTATPRQSHIEAPRPAFLRRSSNRSLELLQETLVEAASGEGDIDEEEAPAQSDFGEGTSEESELDLDMSMDAAGWRAGVMGKDVASASSSDKEEVSSKSGDRPARLTLKAPQPTRRRSYQAYKLIRRPSQEPSDHDSSASSEEEELFDLAFDSATSVSGSSSSPFSFSHSRRSTSSSTSTPRQSWGMLTASSPSVGKRSSKGSVADEVEQEILAEVVRPVPPVAPPPSLPPPHALLKSKSAGQLRRPLQLSSGRFVGQPPPSGLKSAPALHTSAVPIRRPSFDVDANPSATLDPSRRLPPRRSSLPTLQYQSSPRAPSSSSITSPSGIPSPRPPRARPPVPPLPPSSIPTSPVKPLTLGTQTSLLPSAIASRIPPAQARGGKTHRRKDSGTLPYVFDGAAVGGRPSLHLQ